MMFPKEGVCWFSMISLFVGYGAGFQVHGMHKLNGNQRDFDEAQG